ncbi:hypothetical protein ABKN59_008540 [Abortiporus biennis]
MANRPSASSRYSKTPSREVNTLLHTLRGEHYRHSQNILQKAQAQIARAAASHPIQKEVDDLENTNNEVGSSSSLLQDRDGGKGKGVDRSTPEWRKEALSVLFSRMKTPPSSSLDEDLAEMNLEEDKNLKNGTRSTFEEKFPSLTLLCLQVLLRCCPSPGPEFSEDLVPWLPPHLRRDLLRWTAIHEPLSTSRLYSLCELDGHADGELIIIGPQAYLKSNYFSSRMISTGHARIEWDEGEEDWESPSSSNHSPSPLITLALINTSLSISTLLTFPPTITNLALLAISQPTAVYRLTRTCPLLEVLDLSYNPWLARPLGVEDERVIDRVEWRRWGRLRVVGLRECGLQEDSRMVRKVNEGRWTDVEVIGIPTQKLSY